MSEVAGEEATWRFDVDTLRITPGRGRGAHKLRQAIGELSVPLEALTGVSYEPERSGAKLRLQLRDGADPLLRAARGQLQEAADPYQLTVDGSRSGAAEFLADRVREALLVKQVPGGPCQRYLMSGPQVPLTATAGDGSASFDGRQVRLEWNWLAEEDKSAAGAQRIALTDIVEVEWVPLVGVENGRLRFRTTGAPQGLPAKRDPHCITWGLRREGGTTVLLAAAVIARLPHPFANEEPVPENPDGSSDPDAMLRRLRELGELHRDGTLTDEEFTAAKRLLLRDP